jgi:hypothetical protein
MDSHKHADLFYNFDSPLFAHDLYQPEYDAPILSRKMTAMFDDFNQQHMEVF